MENENNLKKIKLLYETKIKELEYKKKLNDLIPLKKLNKEFDVFLERLNKVFILSDKEKKKIKNIFDNFIKDLKK